MTREVDGHFDPCTQGATIVGDVQKVASYTCNFAKRRNLVGAKPFRNR